MAGEKIFGNIPSLYNAPANQLDAARNVVTNPNNIAGVAGKINPITPLTANDLKSQANVSGIAGLKLPDANFGGGTNNEMQSVVITGKRLPKEADAPDMRIRIAPQIAALDQVYGPNDESNILTPLRATMGMMFPYTPTIDWAQSVEYTTTSLVHSNQDYLTYKNTPSTSISINGEFTVQHQIEGEYLLAVMHFLRTVSKMYYGKASFAAPGSGDTSLAGMPPPILTLSGYGNFMFNYLPVIVKDHAYSFKPDISYIDISTAGGKVRLPTVMNISVKLVVQNTPQKNRDEFDLDHFRTGRLMKGTNRGWI